MNKLEFESSPYLKQHENNPVEWHSWSESSLAEAKKLNKPILVSIGYSTCHWCHVMAHESFEDPDTARVMNEHFINIKIDREERPDLDHYFMNAIQAMGISGGWPLHCFLSPDGKPFYGGTYFPPQPKYGRPSWKQILLAIHQAFQNKESEILDQANQLFKHLQQQNEIDQVDNPIQSEINLKEIFTKLQSSFDIENGGFGTQPKFPNSQGIQLLFNIYFLTGNEVAMRHALFSLRQMCMGGIYDQIDGGFCRYSVDANWDVPHFEKMLYDHAQIIQTLSIGFKYNKSQIFKRVILQSMNFFETMMQDSCGLFYAAMNADSEGDEGSYYVWTEELLREVLGDEYISFCKVFSLISLDHQQTDKKVLRISKSLLDDILVENSIMSMTPLVSKIRTIRNKRILPSIDHKMIVSWNAMMVSAYLSWYQVSLDKTILAKALNLMNQIIERCCINEFEVCRYYMDGKARGFGFLEDYVFVIKALLDISYYTQNDKHINKAIQLFEFVHREFKKSDSVLYTVSSTKHSDFKIQQMDWQETTYPNPNAILSWACRNFYEHTQDEHYLNISNSLVQIIKSQALKHPLSMSSWVQQIINTDMDPVILKTNEIENAISILQYLYIPGLISLSKNSNIKDLVFCFDGMCHQVVQSKSEVLSLFSNYNLQFENK